MGESSTRKSRSPDDPTLSGELSELRDILFIPDESDIQRLRNRLEDRESRARDVSKVLPRALSLESSRDGRLDQALQPSVERALKKSVESDPRVLADALFPIIAPAIRRAITDRLREMLEGFNKALEHSLSPRALKWRFEAYRTGRSFSEIVLLRTLRFRVEQVFLIHRETGLALQHVEADSIHSQDPELISAMLTAIQDFVKDSFDVSEEGSLRTVGVGDVNVWIERGTNAVLACVIRGEAPASLRTVFKEVVENIHSEYRKELERFDGDADPFVSSGPLLEPCLETQFIQEDKGISPFTWVVVGSVALMLVAFLGMGVRTHLQWRDYLALLRVEPGITLTGTGMNWSTYEVFGLRDPLSRDPAVLLEESGLDPEEVVARWTPYFALEAKMVEARAISLLDPPPGIELRFEEGILHAKGRAPHDWAAQSRNRAALIPGVVEYRDGELIDEQEQTLQELSDRLEQYVLRFVRGSEFAAGSNDVLRELSESIQRLQELSERMGRLVRVEILGHSDPSGDVETNLRISRLRAERVVSHLVSAGIRAESLVASAVGYSDPIETQAALRNPRLSRRVTIRVASWEAGLK